MRERHDISRFAHERRRDTPNRGRRTVPPYCPPLPITPGNPAGVRALKLYAAPRLAKALEGRVVRCASASDCGAFLAGRAEAGRAAL